MGNWDMELYCMFRMLLITRLSMAVHTTEDSIRYTFFACLEKFGVEPHNIILELPHPNLDDRKIDLYVPPKEDGRGLVAEFKYDRQIPSRKNPPSPQKAGKLFNDLRRLSLFKCDQGIKRCFVYITDAEMAAYFQNPKNRLTWILSRDCDKVIDNAFFQSYSKTLRNTAGQGEPYRVRDVYAADLPKQHFLRIFEVEGTY